MVENSQKTSEGKRRQGGREGKEKTHTSGDKLLDSNKFVG